MSVKQLIQTIMSKSISSFLHQRPLGDKYDFTALRVFPDKNSPFVNPQLDILRNEQVIVLEICNGYGKIQKNGREGWCDMAYLCETVKAKTVTPSISLKPVTSGIALKPVISLKPSISAVTKIQSPLSEYSCNHNTCINNRGIKGVGAIIVVKLKLKHSSTNYVIFGKERNGQYAGEYNVIGGGINRNECPVMAIHREVAEEIKLYEIGDWKKWNKLFKHNSSTTTTFRQFKTLEFMAFLDGNPEDIVKNINTNIGAANRNIHLPSCLRELEKVVLVSTSGEVIGEKKKNVKLSSYALSILKDHADKINRI